MEGAAPLGAALQALPPADLTDEEREWIAAHAVSATSPDMDRIMREIRRVHQRDSMPGFTAVPGGKRFWAHNGADPGAAQPSLLVWYALARQDGRPVWTRHVIDDNSGVGLHFAIADLSGNGKLDIVTANKKGVHLFTQ